jgi:hypothetical protein
MNGIVWRNSDINRMFRTFGIQCLYFESRVAPDQRFGQTRLESDAIHGFRYNDMVEERLMRTSISQRIVLSEHGRHYQGGARFTIPPVKLVNNLYVSVPMYERAFLGDVIVVKSQAIRDFDILKKGYRDQLFAFDVKKILNVSSIDTEGKEHTYSYGDDYTITINGVEPPIVNNSSAIGVGGFGVVLFGGADGVGIVATQNRIANLILISWKDTGNQPANGNNYVVEFLCSPNYVIYDYSDKARATEENNLPRTIMCVKRAYFNPVKPKMDEVDTQQSVMNQTSEVFDEQ